MPTIEEIDAEIARRNAGPTLEQIEAEIARRNSSPNISAAPDVPPVPGGRFMTEQEAQQQGIDIQLPDVQGQPLPAENDYPLQDIIEPLTTVATGAAAVPLAGAAGAVDLLNPFTPIDNAAQVVESLQEAMTFIPRGEKARENLQMIAEKMQPVTKAMETVEETAGEAGYQVGGPVLGAITKAAPTAIMTALGIDNIRKGAATAQRITDSIKQIPSVKAFSLIKDKKTKFSTETIDRLKENAANPELANEVRLFSDDLKNGAVAPGTVGTQLMVLEDKARKVSGNKSADKIKKVREDLENGDVSAVDRLDEVADKMAEPAPEKSLSKYIADGAGGLETDPLMKKAVKQNWDSGVVAAAVGASKPDKARMKNMVEIMKKGKENPIYARNNRPSDVPGQSLLDRVEEIKKLNKESGKNLDNVAISLKGEPADLTEVMGNFINNLEKIGVSVGDDLNPVFKGSAIKFNAGAKRAISGIFKRLKGSNPGKIPDAYDLHIMKLLIDDMVTYGKSGEGIKGKAERILKQLRHDIDNELDSNFPDYNEVNTQYADSISALDSLKDITGKKMNLSGKRANQALGTLLRRLDSNATSRIPLRDSLDNIDDINKKYGNYFDDDIDTLMMMADELDSLFDPVAKSSLAGETAKGARSAARKAATGDAIGAASEGLGLASKLRGVSEKNQFKVMIDILER